MIITLAWILHSHISFMLFHVPGMILKMILINPTWIFGVISGVLKTFIAISREIYSLVPSPGCHFMGQPATCWPVHHTACPPVHRDGQGQLNLVSSSGHISQYQCNESFSRDTRTWVSIETTEISWNIFFAYPKDVEEGWIDNKVIASLFWSSIQIMLSWKGQGRYQ